MCLARRIVVIWMMAVTIHFPFPVCDGDNLRSWESPGRAVRSETPKIDIDLILLGCDLPDDVDDGPVDDDPDEGVGTSFGDYFTSISSRICDPGSRHPVPPMEGDSLAIRWTAERDGVLGPGSGSLLSPGKSRQDGETVMRC